MKLFGHCSGPTGQRRRLRWTEANRRYAPPRRGTGAADGGVARPRAVAICAHQYPGRRGPTISSALDLKMPRDLDKLKRTRICLAGQLYALLPAGSGRVVARGSGGAVRRVLCTRVVNGEVLAGTILGLTRAGHRD